MSLALPGDPQIDRLLAAGQAQQQALQQLHASALVAVYAACVGQEYAKVMMDHDPELGEERKPVEIGLPFRVALDAANVFVSQLTGHKINGKG